LKDQNTKKALITFSNAPVAFVPMATLTPMRVDKEWTWGGGGAGGGMSLTNLFVEGLDFLTKCHLTFRPPLVTFCRSDLITFYILDALISVSVLFHKNHVFWEYVVF
jgi:hypothetical protein